MEEVELPLAFPVSMSEGRVWIALPTSTCVCLVNGASGSLGGASAGVNAGALEKLGNSSIAASCEVNSAMMEALAEVLRQATLTQANKTIAQRNNQTWLHKMDFDDGCERNTVWAAAEMLCVK